MRAKDLRLSRSVASQSSPAIDERIAPRLEAESQKSPARGDSAMTIFRLSQFRSRKRVRAEIQKDGAYLEGLS
jgi:hypothetical protein